MSPGYGTGKRKQVGRYRIEERRKRAGLSQARLAKEAGLRYQNTVSLAERGLASPQNTAAIRSVLFMAETRRREQRRRERVIVYQRHVFEAVPDGTEKRALLGAMKDRVWDLLCDGNVDGADILLEFVPERIGRALLDCFFKEPNEQQATEEGVQ